MSTKDKFNSILQSKFNNWEHPVGTGDWKEMHNQLNNARKAKMRMKWAAAGGSVVVLLSGIGIYTLLNKPIDSKESTAISSSVNTSVKNNVSTPVAQNKNIVVATQVAAPVKENRNANQHAVNNTITAENTAKENIVASKINNTVAPLATDVNKASVASNLSPKTARASNSGPLVVTISGASTICSGTSVNLCSSISGGSGEGSYVWQPGNFTSKCITVSPTSNTVYTLVVTDNSGSSSATASITVNPSPLVSFNSDIQNGCAPIGIQFKNLSSGAGGNTTSWAWNFGNGDVSNAENPIYNYQNAGNYNVSLTVTAANGCSSTLSVPDMITIYSNPKASFSLSSQATSAGTTVQFKDQSTDAYGINSWSWSFSDGLDNTSNTENPSHVYSDTGMYCTRLVVINTHGCRDTTTNCLAIAPIFNLYIPSAFSPNGDGKNDIFQPEGQYVKNFEMYIFNRQGEQVYHTIDISKGWNGGMKGGLKICPEDTYIYKISVTDAQNKNHEYTGQVTLLK